MRESIGKLTWNVQQDEIPPAGIIHDLQLLKVLDHDRVQNISHITLVVRIPHVVNAHPDPKEGIFGRPGRSRWVGSNTVAEFSDLVDEAKDSALKGHDKIRIGGGAAVGKVVGEQEGFVVFGDEEADPIGAAAGGVAWEGWVAEGVGG